MKYRKKILLIFLAFAMVSLQLMAPLTTNANEVTEMDESLDPSETIEFELEEVEVDSDDASSDFEDNLYDGEQELDDEYLGFEEVMLDLESVESSDETNNQPQSAIAEDVPELMFADDMLLDIEEDEIFEPIDAFSRSATPGAVGSGLVQFVLEPVASTLPAGVTMAQARAAAFSASTMVHPLYAGETTNSVATGINGRFGRDAIYLGTSANGNRFRVMIAGFVGYVDRTGPRNACGNNQPCRITVPINNVNRTFEVRMNAIFVPFGNYPSTGTETVRSTSHYVNRNGELYRYLTNNVTSSGGFVRFLTGPAPSWMSQDTRYYSYDGVYFYRNPRNIRIDGRGAVNETPRFNYFQYLSFRSSSTVTATQLNNFLTNQSLHGINTSTSVMRNQGNAFINAQNRYGTNALLMYSKAMLESAGGTSAIARNNNNLFGLGAFDATPGTSAWDFATPAASVNDLANGWLSRGYLWSGDWRYEGPHVGHKGSGINVRYATDPYWGEKIAGWAFRIDRTRPANSRDTNREQFAIRRNTSAVAVENSAGTTLYTANSRQASYFPFLVTGTSGDRLRILTDPAIVNGTVNRTALFNRTNAVGFIPNTNVWRVGASSPNPGDTPPSTDYEISGMVQTGVTRRNTAFRQGPGSKYDLIRTVNGSTNVRITGKTGIWFRVIVDGTTGFMRQSAVARTRQSAVVATNNAHVRAGRGTSHRSLTRVSRGQRVTVARRSAHWSRITVNGHTGWIRNRDLHTDNAMRPGRTTVNNVAIHTRPRANATIRRRLPRHTRLMIVQRTTDGWSQIRIRHSGGTLHGWVRTNQIERSVQTRQLVQNGVLRSGPGTNFSNLRTIPRNTTVTIRARVGSWYYVYVTINGRRHTGWQHQNNLQRLTLP
jgi:uncharacterized protein YgiM (DUF1202 family)